MRLIFFASPGQKCNGSYCLVHLWQASVKSRCSFGFVQKIRRPYRGDADECWQGDQGNDDVSMGKTSCKPKYTVLKAFFGQTHRGEVTPVLKNADKRAGGVVQKVVNQADVFSGHCLRCFPTCCGRQVGCLDVSLFFKTGLMMRVLAELMDGRR